MWKFAVVKLCLIEPGHDFFDLLSSRIREALFGSDNPEAILLENPDGANVISSCTSKDGTVCHFGEKQLQRARSHSTPPELSPDPVTDFSIPFVKIANDVPGYLIVHNDCSDSHVIARHHTLPVPVERFTI
jgi:hypothetical protein